MSVIKSKPTAETKPTEFGKSPMNQLLEDLKQKMNEIPSRIVSGSSDVHTIPKCCSGIIFIPVDVDFEYVPHVTLQCSDNLNGINMCLISSDDKKVIRVSIENLLDVERTVRINYFLK
jgi:hypothetical protein